MAHPRPWRQTGFSRADILMVLALVAISAGVAVPQVASHLEQTRNGRAVDDIRRIETALAAYRQRHHRLPDDLQQLSITRTTDPWGQPYVYMNFATRGLSEQRYYHDLPLNSDYDLYSRGPDGGTDIAVNAALAHDDVVRGRDGEFIGLAADF